jgi:hypothetical protein
MTEFRTIRCANVAYFGAERTDTIVKLTLSRKHIRSKQAKLRAIQHQSQMLRPRVLSADFETMRHRHGQTHAVTLQQRVHRSADLQTEAVGGEFRHSVATTNEARGSLYATQSSCFSVRATRRGDCAVAGVYAATGRNLCKREPFRNKRQASGSPRTATSKRDGMRTAKQESNRRELLSIRHRQKQLGRGLRLMYEQVLREPVPVEMLEALRAAERDVVC